MNHALTIISGVVLLHLATLNSLAMYMGLGLDTWLPAPKAVLADRLHIIGATLVLSGAIIIIASAAFGFLKFGIFAGGALALADPILIYQALKRYSERDLH